MCLPSVQVYVGAGHTDRLSLTGNFDGTGDQTVLVNNTIGGPDGFLGIISMAAFSSVVLGNNVTVVDSFSNRATRGLSHAQTGRYS